MTIRPSVLTFIIFGTLIGHLNAEQPKSNAGARLKKKPNIILVYADDISAREFPIYGSSKWTKDKGIDTSDKSFQAKTPVLDRMAREGCWIKTAWASVVCSPSRAMMMTGRYAHLHKWWNNSYKGRYRSSKGKVVTWPLYMSSPMLIGHCAQKGGYGTYWAGKTQMAGDLREFGFDQGCFTPGNLADKDNPHTDFKLIEKKIDGENVIFNADTDRTHDTYLQHGWYFYPHIRLMNHDEKDFQWWPNSPETEKSFGLGTYGPDIELDFIFEFMDKQHAKEEPFFIYHTTHLGHGAFDWLNPDNGQCWPGTPKIEWDGTKYVRTEPKITGDRGNYETNETVTDNGIQSHINYLDYQMWLYRNKVKEMGIADNTVIIFCADNGTSGYGKNSHDRQKGVHVPMIIYAPGMTKHGEQDVLVNMSDLLPTIAELAGVEIPSDYPHNGKSLVPFLLSDQPEHREYIYGYSRQRQIIRGNLVMKDGNDKWWDVSEEPEDLISFAEIKDWDKFSQAHRDERNRLTKVLPEFDLFETEPDAPGHDLPPKTSTKKKPKVASANSSGGWSPAFNDDFEGRSSIGERYTTALGMEDAWTVVDGILVGKQTRDDHGSVIRTEIDFSDVDIRFDFRFNGGKSFNFVIDDKNEKSVHAGHVARASIFPKRLIISDDKTGGMNLEVRKMRKDKNLSKEDSKKLEGIMRSTRSSVPIEIKTGKWHNLRIRMKNDIMKVFIDGELATSLRSKGFAHPTKNKLGFTVNGESIEFDNFKILKPKNAQAK